MMLLHHHGWVLLIGEVHNGVHPAIGEMVPDSVLKVNEAAGLHREGHHAGMAEVVPFLGGRGMDRAELIW